MTSGRKVFYEPEYLRDSVENHIRNLPDKESRIDYLTIVPDGEPTLDLNLGKLIRLLKPIKFNIAVITNSTLLDDPEVREDLKLADLVSIKVDSVDKKIWKRIDRPHGKLVPGNILHGIEAFAASYEGELITETMLVKDLNDGEDSLHRTSEFLGKLNPDKVYISIPTRPPAENWVAPPDENNINAAFQIYQQSGLRVEYLIGYEGNEFSSTGDFERDLLSITAVHPMREDAVIDLVKRTGGNMDIVEKLVQAGSLIISEYHQNRFYLRKLK